MIFIHEEYKCNTCDGTWDYLIPVKRHKTIKECPACHSKDVKVTSKEKLDLNIKTGSKNGK